MKREKKNTSGNGKFYRVSVVHFYLYSGFDVDKKFTTDGKSIVQEGKHYCLQMGYWCWKNAWEYPEEIIPFIKHKLYKMLSVSLNKCINSL